VSQTDAESACAFAEEGLHRGQVEARASAEAALSSARASGAGVVEAWAHQILGEIDYDELAYGPALAHLDAAVALREQLLGPSADMTRSSLAIRSIVLVGEDRRGDAEHDLQRAAKAGRPAPEGPDDAAVNARLWVGLGAAYATLDHNAAARPILEAVLATEPSGKCSPFAIANACVQLSMVFEESGDPARAAALLERTIAVRRAIIGEPSLRVGLALSALATSRLRSGRIDEGRALAHASAAMLAACGREEHPRASLVYLGIAVAEVVSGRGPASERWLTRAIELESRTFGAAHPRAASMLATAATSYAKRSFHGRAAELAQQAAAIFATRLDVCGDAFEGAICQGFLSLRHAKRYDAIVRWLEPLAAKLERMKPLPEQALGPLLNMLGEGYYAAGRLAKAEAALRRALVLAERVHGDASDEVRTVLVNLVNLLGKQRRVDEARAAAERAQRIADGMEGSGVSPFRSRWRWGSA
jgi:tetratricopeptide (TPR) repeat protein